MTKITKLRGGMTLNLYQCLDDFENQYRHVDNNDGNGNGNFALPQMQRQTAVNIPSTRSIRYTDILNNIQYKYDDENKENAFRRYLIERNIDYRLFNNPININVYINNISYQLSCMPDTTIFNIKIKIIEEYNKKRLNINNNGNNITNMSQEFYDEFIKLIGDTQELFNNFDYFNLDQRLPLVDHHLPLRYLKLKHKNSFLENDNNILLDYRIITGAEIILEIDNNIRNR
jgi:hypothetical protein